MDNIIMVIMMLGTLLLIASDTPKSIENIKNKYFPLIEISFVKTEGDTTFFICEQIQKIYIVKFDTYDLQYTGIQQTYHVRHVSNGWGRPKLEHNGKLYTLFEV